MTTAAALSMPRPITVDAVDTATVVSSRDLCRHYRRGSEIVRALDGANFDVAAGEFLAIVGPSGAGKSTLLHLLGCMDTPTSGELRVDGRSTAGLNDRQLTRLRREAVGFVFQHFGLLPTLTVAENVALPALFARRQVSKRVEELLDRVGLAHRRQHRPHELSGGEMQRAAIARALINSPRMLLADEPTGNLDSHTGATIVELFSELNSDGLTLVVVTHNAALAAAASRLLSLRDGRIVS